MSTTFFHQNVGVPPPSPPCVCLTTATLCPQNWLGITIMCLIVGYHFVIAEPSNKAA